MKNNKKDALGEQAKELYQDAIHDLDAKELFLQFGKVLEEKKVIPFVTALDAIRMLLTDILGKLIMARGITDKEEGAETVRKALKGVCELIEKDFEKLFASGDFESKVE